MLNQGVQFLIRIFWQTVFLSSFFQFLTGNAVPLLIWLSLKTFATGGASEHFTITVLFLLVPPQSPFQFERLLTLMAVECGEKWEVGVDALCVQFQVSLQSEGLLTLSTLPLFLVCEKMSLFNVSPHCFLPCELFTTMETMVLLSWFLEWILGWHLMNLSHVSFEILQMSKFFTTCFASVVF